MSSIMIYPILLKFKFQTTVQLIGQFIDSPQFQMYIYIIKQ